MGIISRLYDFTAGQTIQSQQVDDELNQLVAAINNVEPANLSAGAKNLFLQLASAGSRKVAFGTWGFAWNTAGISSDPATVTHGLGTTPSQVFIQLTNDPGQVASTHVTAQDATTFTAKAHTASSVSVGGSIGFYWLAIG